MPGRNFHAKLAGMRWLLPLGLAGLLACTSKPPPPPAPAAPPPVVSEEVLNRPVQSRRAVVRHILVGWKDLATNYARQPMDARARERDQVTAEQLVRSIQRRVADGEDFLKLMKEYSEDRGSAELGTSYEVRPDAQFEPQFQALSLRLKPGEVGVCQSAYGFHLVKRFE